MKGNSSDLSGKMVTVGRKTITPLTPSDTAAKHCNALPCDIRAVVSSNWLSKQTGKANVNLQELREFFTFNKACMCVCILDSHLHLTSHQTSPPPSLILSVVPTAPGMHRAAIVDLFNKVVF